MTLTITSRLPRAVGAGFRPGVRIATRLAFQSRTAVTLPFRLPDPKNEPNVRLGPGQNELRSHYISCANNRETSFITKEARQSVPT